VIVDPATGEGIVNSTGPDGNCGFPYTDEEIVWFGKMLESADERLNADARTKLTASLRANRERIEAERAKAEAEAKNAKLEAEARRAEAKAETKKAKAKSQEDETDEQDKDDGNG
jgi:hypothetical protein